MPLNFSTKSVAANAVRRLKERVGLHEVSPRLGSELIWEIYQHSQELNRKRVHFAVRNWMVLFDELIYVYSCFHIALIHGVMEKKGGVTLEQKVYSVLLGSIVFQMIAIRSLILLGHDVSAKNSARLLGEYLDLIEYLLLEPSLCAEFHKMQTPEESNKFWHQHIAKRKLRKKLVALRKQIWADREDWIDSLEEWRLDEAKILSASAHPSMTASFMTIANGGFVGKAGTGAFGSVDVTSIRTLRFCFFISCEVLEVMYGSNLIRLADRSLKAIGHFIDVVERSAEFTENLFIYALENQDKAMLSVPEIALGNKPKQARE